MSLSQNRLQEERLVLLLSCPLVNAALLTFPCNLISKQWRKDHPFGFYAKPQRTENGTLDLKVWECGIPGKEKTIWEGGLFKMTITFPEGQFTPARFCPCCT